MAELTTLGAPIPAAAPAVRAVPAALVSAALMGTSALAYVFTVLAARALAPHAYGELAALLGVALVGAVPATGLQTAAALHLGGHRGDPAPVVRRLHATALAGAAAVAVVGAFAIAPVVGLLHLPDPFALGWVLVLLVAHTVVGGYEGVLQGTGRYARMAVVTTSFGVAKLVGGTVGLLVGGTPTAALAGMALGSSLGVLAGWLGADRPGVARGIGAPGRSALRASGALLGFVLLLNLDVLLARHHLPGAQAGEYAVAAVFAKVAFWLPQGVGVVLLPRLADAGSRCARRRPGDRGRRRPRRRAHAARRRCSGAPPCPWSAARRTARAWAVRCGCSPCWARCSPSSSCCSTPASRPRTAVRSSASGSRPSSSASRWRRSPRPGTCRCCRSR